MSDVVTIIECSPSWPRSAADLAPLLKGNGSIYVLEPFAAYHHTGRLRFFPTLIPPGVEAMIAEGRLQILPAARLEPNALMFGAWQGAMDNLDTAFAVLRTKWRRPLSRVVRELGIDAEKAFRQTLADRLGVFFAVNGLLQRLAALFPDNILDVYSGACPALYKELQDLLRAAGANVRIPARVRLRSPRPMRWTVERWAAHLAELGYLALQSMRALLPSGKPSRIPDVPCSIGMNVNAPGRQLLNKQMGADFLVDGVNIRREDMLYVLPGDSLRPGAGTALTPEQETRLREIGGTAFPAPSAWAFSSPAGLWFVLLVSGLLSGPDSGLVCRPAAAVCTHYYRWKQAAWALRLKHFIAYADFGPPHVGRNIALHEAGTRTWYVQDSNNSSIVLRKRTADGPPLHPFWTDLHYTDMACWCEASAAYYRAHGFSGQSHVVGCLRSSYLQDRTKVRREGGFGGIKQETFVLAAFDSTYTINLQTTYEMGIAFAKDIIGLADELEGLHIFFKEKNARSFHLSAAPCLGKVLVAQYERMDAHPRITMCTHAMDAAKLISGADMIISFPFTSTTFEALAGNRYALWHDASGIFRDILYASFPRLVSHSYEELRERIAANQKDSEVTFAAPIPLDSPHMDPFRDGMALERLRILILSAAENRAT